MVPKWLKVAALSALGVAIVLGTLVIGARVAFRPTLTTDPSAFADAEVRRATVTAPGARHLVVVFRGIGGGPMPDVRAAIHETFPGADLLIPRYSTSSLSSEDPRDVVRLFLAAIDRAHKESPYDRITLVGYSMGALVARKALVCAYTGCPADYNMQPLREWRSRVDRMVLLAGMNRGWATHCEKVVSVEDAHGVGYENDCRAPLMSWPQWIEAEWAQRFGPLFGVGGLILSVQRGQPFVANLRLEWLALEQKERLPPVVQLLGDIDEVVSFSDNLDQFVTANFAFIKLEGFTNHANVVEMAGPQGRERKARFVEALTWPLERLRATYTQPPNPDYKPDPTITRVVLIVHGIRDDGRWARDLGAEFEKADSETRFFARSYGYFAALHFLMPARMEANVRWFVDQYTELRALFPQAKFYFVGHSNGTYMLAQAVAQYHEVTFEKVVLAGSVVQTGFPWSQYKGRVKAVRNYRASADLVVAALPSFFEHIRWYLRVGGAGHAGFTDDYAREGESRYFADGGHSAVFGNPQNYTALVQYILDRGGCGGGRECDAHELAKRTDVQSGWVDWVYRLSVLIWMGAVVGIGLLSYWLSRVVRGSTSHHGWRGYLGRSLITGASVVALALVILRYI